MSDSFLLHKLRTLVNDLAAASPDHQTLINRIHAEINSIEQQLQSVLHSFEFLLSEHGELVAGNGGGDERPDEVPEAQWIIFQRVRFSANPVDRQTLRDLIARFSVLDDFAHS